MEIFTKRCQSLKAIENEDLMRQCVFIKNWPHYDLQTFAWRWRGQKIGSGWQIGSFSGHQIQSVSWLLKYCISASWFLGKPSFFEWWIFDLLTKHIFSSFLESDSCCCRTENQISKMMYFKTMCRFEMSQFYSW